MREMYAVTVPSEGLVDVRHSAAGLDPSALREHGVERCHLYFAGDVFILWLEGRDDQGLLERLRENAGGRSLLDSLETHAWFSKLKLQLESVARAGRPLSASAEEAREQGLVTAVASYGINPTHEEPLRRDLQEALPSLERGPHLEFLYGRGLIVRFEARGPEEVHDVLAGRQGSQLQRVLNEHTGYDHEAWSSPLAFDLESVERGVLSRFNEQPQRPPSRDPSGQGRGDVQGTWDPPPPFRNPPRP